MCTRVSVTINKRIYLWRGSDMAGANLKMDTLGCVTDVLGESGWRACVRVMMVKVKVARVERNSSHCRQMSASDSVCGG
jgi:hypothetical protein